MYKIHENDKSKVKCYLQAKMCRPRDKGHLKILCYSMYSVFVEIIGCSTQTHKVLFEINMLNFSVKLVLEVFY